MRYQWLSPSLSKRGRSGFCVCAVRCHGFDRRTRECANANQARSDYFQLRRPGLCSSQDYAAHGRWKGRRQHKAQSSDSGI